MRIPPLDAERVTLLAQGEALWKPHVRLRLTPANSPDHAAHGVHVHKHHERLRAYIRALRNEPRDT